MPISFDGHNLPPPPLVEIELTDLPKPGGAMAPPAPPGTTGLVLVAQKKPSKRLQQLEGQDFSEQMDLTVPALYYTYYFSHLMTYYIPSGDKRVPLQ